MKTHILITFDVPNKVNPPGKGQITSAQIAKRRAEIAAELEQLKSRPNGK